MLSPNVNILSQESTERGTATHYWHDRSDDEILRLRLKDLGLSVADTGLQLLANQLLLELRATGFKYLTPKFYLGDEWFTPDESGYISMPFFLANQRLIELEKKMMGNAEGEDVNYAMRILRHEAGHCFDHAYHVSTTTTWRHLFGDRRRPYRPDSYKYVRDSRDYVHNLADCYAQAHPDEDFAETFAVWLNPEINWRDEYRDWPRALSKLEYVNDIVNVYRSQKPRYACQRPMSAVANLRSTLATHYGRRLRRSHCR